jgi:DNA (cytosine-5)-methyltransferase 1
MVLAADHFCVSIEALSVCGEMVSFVIDGLGMACSRETVRYIDLCCGIGGFRVALEQLDGAALQFKCVLSADIKNDALRTYNANFGEANEPTDINGLSPAAVPAFDLLCAGFPCQPFSSAGQRRGFDDERGSMIFRILDLCKHHRPRWVVLENVANLLTIQNGQCIRRIVELFTSLGYNVTYHQLNSMNFGVPQSRERVYIICSTDPLDHMETIQPHAPVTLKSVLDLSDTRSDLPPQFMQAILTAKKTRNIFGAKISDKRGGVDNIHSWDLDACGPTNASERQLMNSIMLQRRKKHWAETKNVAWMDGMPLSLAEIRTFSDIPALKETLDGLVAKNYLRLEHPKDLVGNVRVPAPDSPIGYNICKGKLSFPISRILDPDGVSPTLTATDSNKLGVFVNDHCVRRLNKLEMRRICGFPDEFIVPDGVNAYDLFGNMATPPVLKAIFDQLFSEVA